VSTQYKNQISQKRASLGLSQRALAKAVGTSQQQIQRIETGVQAVRIDLAVKIAAALNSSLAEIFPSISTGTVTKKSRLLQIATPPLHSEQMAKAGIETYPIQWTLRIGFEGDREFDYSVSAAEKERVSSILRKETFDFVVFDTDTKRIAANRTKINYANFLFDPAGMEEEKEENLDSYNVTVIFAGNKEPVKFGVEPDDLDVNKDDQGFRSQFQRLFIYLEGYSVDEDEILWFDDEDAEQVLIRAKQVLLIEAPLLCCEPELWRSHIENFDEDVSDSKENHVEKSNVRGQK